MSSVRKLGAHVWVPAALLILVAGVSLASSTLRPAVASELRGSVPGIAVWSGGPVTELVEAAREAGCELHMISVVQQGAMLHRTVGFEPAAAWLAAFPGDLIPPGTSVMLTCNRASGGIVEAAPTPTSPPAAAPPAPATTPTPVPAIEPTPTPAPPSTPVTGSGELRGTVPGVALWGGGSVAELVEAAREAGCELHLVSVTYQGIMVHRTIGFEPSEQWLQAFPGDEIPPNTMAILTCARATSAPSTPATQPTPQPTPAAPPSATPGATPSPVPSPTAAPTPTQAPTPPSSPGPFDSAAEQRMVDLVNNERRSAGLAPLEIDPALTEVARAHSLDMLQRGYFAHVNPEGESPFDRMRNAGIAFTTAGENLSGASTVERAHAGLMNSPGHRANILNPHYARIGIGAVQGGAYGMLFTQLLAR